MSTNSPNTNGGKRERCQCLAAEREGNAWELWNMHYVMWKVESLTLEVWQNINRERKETVGKYFRPGGEQKPTQSNGSQM